MNKHLKYIMIPKSTTIKETMQIIDSAPHKHAPSGIALIIDKNKSLKGIVTDGDIRRAILKNINLNSSIEKIMVKDPITVNKNLSNQEMLSIILEKVKFSKRLHNFKIDKVIVVNDQNKVVNIISLFELWSSLKVESKVITIVGLGYVGLTLAVVMADRGLDVIGVETNLKILKDLKNNRAHFHEVGLNALLKYHINKKFKITNKILPEQSNIYIICVGTPINKNKRIITADVKKAAKLIGKILKKGDLVVLRSTVPVGTSREIVLPILEKESNLKAGQDFYLSFAPERTLEGKALEELRNLPQIVGGLDKNSIELTANLFRTLTPSIINVESLESAEMIKLINNSFRDLVFSYANELALICDRYNLDTVKLINAANEGYPRNRVAYPSPGVGGVCLSKDPYIFIEVGRKVGVVPNLVKYSRQINEHMPVFITESILNFFKKKKTKISFQKIFVIGFAFKGDPETSDTRKSTTLDIIELLKKQTKKIYGYDPVASKDEIKKYAIPCNLKEGFKGAGCVIVANNHKSYRDIDIFNLLKSMKKPGLFFDSWHLFESKDISRIKGITYLGLGTESPS